MRVSMVCSPVLVSFLGGVFGGWYAVVSLVGWVFFIGVSMVFWVVDLGGFTDLLEQY